MGLAGLSGRKMAVGDMLRSRRENSAAGAGSSPLTRVKGGSEQQGWEGGDNKHPLVVSRHH